MTVSKSQQTALITLKMLSAHNVLLDIGLTLKVTVIYFPADVFKLMMQESVVFASKDTSLTVKETVKYYLRIVLKLMITDCVYNVHKAIL